MPFQMNPAERRCLDHSMVVCKVLYCQTSGREPRRDCAIYALQQVRKGTLHRANYYAARHHDPLGSHREWLQAQACYKLRKGLCPVSVPLLVLSAPANSARLAARQHACMNLKPNRLAWAPFASIDPILSGSQVHSSQETGRLY